MPKAVSFLQYSLIITIGLLLVTLSLKYAAVYNGLLQKLCKKYAFLRGPCMLFCEERPQVEDGENILIANREQNIVDGKAFNASFWINKCTLIVMVIIYLFMTMTMIPLFNLY